MLKIFGFLFIFLEIANAHALVPPMSEQELKEESSLIVTGRVVSVEKFKKPFKDSCYKWQTYVAQFEVSTTEKGRSEKIIAIYYNNKIKDRSGQHCVGGETSYSLGVNSNYKLYLENFSSQGANAFEFINWAGVLHLGGEQTNAESTSCECDTNLTPN